LSSPCLNEKKEGEIYWSNTYLIDFNDLEKIQEPEKGGGIIEWISFDHIKKQNNNSSFSSYNRVLLENYLKYEKNKINKNE
jgi:hypothetical protein